MKTMYLIYFKFFFIVVFFSILGSCQNNDTFIEKTNYENNNNILTIEEAKDFFEKGILSRNGNVNEDFALNPGDFTPIWENADLSQDLENANVDVNILGNKQYRVLKNYSVGSHYITRKINIMHKMVISKNLNSNNLTKSFISIIPEYSSVITNNEAYNFVTLSNEKQFSGIIIYSLPGVKIPIKIEKYTNGNKDVGLFIPLLKNKTNFSLHRLNQLLGGIEFQSSQGLYSRSGEYDDFFDWFEDEIWNDAEHGDHYEMNNDGDGNWWLEDNDGNIYEIPDYLMDNEDVSFDYDDNIYDYDDDIVGFDQDFMVLLKVFHTICGSYLGTVNPSSPGVEIFHCNKCNVDVTVRY